jgi:AcrR family transcriptional regulator
MSKPSRGEQTKSAIIDAALGLFEEVGFEATTMRAVAQRAGVSVGNAYYYFDSKDELIQGFYDQAAERHLEVSVERLAGVTDLSRRIHDHVDSWFEIMSGYHEFAASFFRTAADPTSPLSPFSTESQPARDAAIARWRSVVDGSDTEIPALVADELPELLWLYQMGLVMFWVHDRSADQIATKMLAARTVPLIVRIAGLVDLPELRGVVDEVLALLRDARVMLT